jgi:plastocyanin
MAGPRELHMSEGGRWGLALAIAAVLGTAAACGGGGDSPTAPTPPTTGGGDTGTISDQATITITSAGVVSPSSVTIRQGGRVTFVNSHSGSHDIASDPHPTHENCPPINEVGFLTSGQSRTSGNLNSVRTCGFHDHNDPSATGLQGRITIVAQ